MIRAHGWSPEQAEQPTAESAEQPTAAADEPQCEPTAAEEVRCFVVELDFDYLPHNDGNRLLNGQATGEALTFGFTPKGFTVGSGIRLRVSGESFSKAIEDLADTGSVHFPSKVR